MTDLLQYVQQAETDTEAHTAHETPPTAKRQLLDCLRGDIMNAEQRVPTSSELETEAYLCEPVHTEDPLEWWKFNDYKFPKIAILARKYLRVPATEVPSERSFSVAGNTVTRRRALLDPAKVDELLFIHKNYKFPAVTSSSTATSSTSEVTGASCD
jgi:hypothetical protein